MRSANSRKPVRYQIKSELFFASNSLKMCTQGLWHKVDLDHQMKCIYLSIQANLDLDTAPR